MRLYEEANLEKLERATTQEEREKRSKRVEAIKKCKEIMADVKQYVKKFDFGGAKMKPYIIDNKFYLQVNNIQEFKNLVDEANRLSKELNQVMHKLNNFDLEVEFSVKGKDDK